MGKTTTTTETRTFQKDDLWFEETVETTVVESKDGSRTTTKTTTKQLPGPPGSARPESPSSDSSESDQKEDGGGFLSRLRGRKSSKGGSSSSDDETIKNLSDYDKTFAKDVLDSINTHRNKHGVSSLKLSDRLTSEATRWAVHCANKDKMQHKQHKDTGENVYRLSANMPVEKNVASGQKIVDHWYSEVEKHKFGDEPSGAKLDSGHFTQMVWKDTTQLGVGIAMSASKRNIYIVAFFNPKGNWMGEFSSHVPPVGGFPASSKFSNLTSKVGDKLQRLSLGSSSSDEEEGDFNAAVLKAHNDYRKKHGVPTLELSDKLNKFSENWAKIIAKKDRMEHRPNNEYGENLYAKWASNPNHSIPGKEAVESWYSEISDHVFGKEPKSLATGHFTQVVWEDSKTLGVGMARNKKSGKLYVVCNYEPAGNFVGRFSKKVPPPV